MALGLPLGSGAASASIPSAYRQDLRVPYSMQYSLTIERQQGNTGLRASYVGTASRQGIYRYFGGVDNQNALGANPTVDRNGNPVRPRNATSDLQQFSIFGRDPLRPSFDPYRNSTNSKDLVALNFPSLATGQVMMAVSR